MNKKNFTMDMGDHKRIMVVNFPYDKRNSDPKKDYGIGGLRIFYIYLKDNNAVQMLFSARSYLPKVNYKQHEYSSYNLNAYDIGYHAESPEHEGQTSMDCNLINSGKCYYDGYSLYAEELFNDRIQHAEDPENEIWLVLEEYWNEKFN